MSKLKEQSKDVAVVVEKAIQLGRGHSFRADPAKELGKGGYPKCVLIVKGLAGYQLEVFN